MLTLRSDSDCPVALAALLTLTPSSFTRRIALACAGVNRRSRSCTTIALIAASQ